MRKLGIPLPASALEEVKTNLQWETLKVPAFRVQGIGFGAEIRLGGQGLFSRECCLLGILVKSPACQLQQGLATWRDEPCVSSAATHAAIAGVSSPLWGLQHARRRS